MIMIMIVYRVEAEKPVHPFSCIQYYTNKIVYTYNNYIKHISYET